MKICCICEDKNSAYKCPTCRQSYCSVGCCKKHKEDGCEDVGPSETSSDKETTNEKSYDYPTEDTVHPDRLERLRDSESVKECLKNPHVRNIVAAILNDADPTKAIGLAMTEPIFVELADACLRVVEPTDDDKPF